MNLPKLIFGIVALIIAVLMVFLFPGAGWETTVVGIVASIAAQFGITNWRTEYDSVKSWFQSKTIWGALLVVVPVIVLVLAPIVLPLIGWVMPAWLSSALDWIIVAGGGTLLYGIFDVVKTKAAQAPR